jgi:hypothetical protein
MLVNWYIETTVCDKTGIELTESRDHEGGNCLDSKNILSKIFEVPIKIFHLRSGFIKQTLTSEK